MTTPRPHLRAVPAPGSRVVPLDHLATIVADGATVALGGTWLSSRPMAAVRQLIRGGRRDLRIVSLTGGLEVDVLVGAGVAREVAFCFVSLGPFGLAPRFGAAVAAGAIVTDEHSGHGLTVAIEAASRGLESMPFFGPIGTSLGSRYAEASSCSEETPVQLAAREVIDVAILHAEAATRDGHVLLAGTVGLDVVTARAAARVVVTTERLVDRLPSSGSRYLSPSNVDDVIVVPWGAHPLAHVPDYGLDWRSLLAYVEAAETADGFERWLRDDLAEDEAARTARLDARRQDLLRLTASAGAWT